VFKPQKIPQPKFCEGSDPWTSTGSVPMIKQLNKNKIKKLN